MSREQEDVILALTKLCRELNVTNLLQVGAEDGYEAYFIAEAIGISGHAIDADPKCEPFIKGLDFHRAYIGATNAQGVPFFVNSNVGLSSPYKRGNCEEERSYNMVTLDTFCANTGIRPDALIIDTEGSTLDVLEGASYTLPDVQLIYAEVQTKNLRAGIRSADEVDAFLVARGFTKRPGLPAYDVTDQSNVCYVRKNETPS